MSASPLPNLCTGGHVLVVTARYPPQPGGSSVLMHNLLARFNPESYTIVTAQGAAEASIDVRQPARVHRIMSSVGFSSRLDRRWRDWQLPWAVSRLVRLVERHQPRLLVGVYPDFHFLSAAREAARRARVPWIAYFHDTLAEALSTGHLAAQAAQLQENVFREAARVLVMSRGMADLYREKYELACRPLEHTYLEVIPEALPNSPAARQAFWGGAIYGINARALARVSTALASMQCPLLLATSTSLANLARVDIGGDHLKIGFYSSRREYLEVLRQQGLLVLALDWPDESPIHHEELATIFPTKTPEYLASGRPILVHCPENYFLARFFHENNCGLVVSDRSVSALAGAVGQLLENSGETREMARAALRAAHLFSADRVASCFHDEVRRAERLSWGEQAPGVTAPDTRCGAIAGDGA
jgi:glycosyltransferase involved in cell wall biosynthesis